MPKHKMITYKTAGVDIDQAEAFLQQIRGLVKTTKRDGWLSNIGSFGGFFELLGNYRHPVLVSSTDGVGTKLKLAFISGIHNTVGVDLVAMSVNDCLCSGAQPLFFLDYIATGKIDKKTLVKVIEGIVCGCRAANCALVGGETAEMPDFYQPGEYDLSGFCVGVVEKSKIISPSSVKTGDRLIGLGSSGLHSNSFSLVRKLFSAKELKKRAKEFLTPTRIYVKPVLSLLNNFHSGQTGIVKGIAHITGGAFIDKIPRIIPAGLAVQICKNSWPIPAVFEEMKQRSGLEPEQMFRTFNMGIGMVLVVPPKHSQPVMKFLKAKFSLAAWEIGQIVKGNRQVLL